MGIAFCSTHGTLHHDGDHPQGRVSCFRRLQDLSTLSNRSSREIQTNPLGWPTSLCKPHTRCGLDL